MKHIAAVADVKKTYHEHSQEKNAAHIATILLPLDQNPETDRESWKDIDITTKMWKMRQIRSTGKRYKSLQSVLLEW